MNKYFIFYSLLLLCFHNQSYCQKYDVASIPENLKENANAVIRWDEAHYEIKNLHNATYRSHFVVTIINNDADYFAQEDLWYDSSSEIISFTGKIYDANGNLIKESKKKDIRDAAYSSYSVYDDNRYKYLDLTHKELPYTVEIIYEQKFSNLFYISDWYTTSSDNVSLEYSKFTMTSPKDLNPRYKILGSDLRPLISQTEDIVTTIFSFRDLKAKEKEPFGIPAYKNAPRVLIVPKVFDFDGYEGSFETWDKFSSWMSSLIQDRTELTPQLIDDIKMLTKDLSSNEEKIKTIYEYLQNNTRYVSIQLGIGGYQPFSAMEVNEKGYGDCKALSNYMYAMLSSLDINSHHVLVDAGNNPRPIDKNFPNNTFNHMILCVPNAGDTLWLECTSQTNPFGYQGKFTGDRDVLLITEDGGKIVHTTVYNKEDNLQTRSATVSLDIEGNGTVNSTTIYKGLQYENYNLDYISNQSPDKQKEWILEYTDIPSFELNEFSFDLEESKIPSITQTTNLSLKKYGQSSGDRLFLPLNLMNKNTYVPKRILERKTDISVSVPYIDIDTISYIIPETIHPEHVPDPITISSEFGEYQSSVQIENGKVIYVRKLGINKGSYPKERYDEFRAFHKKIRKADQAKIVFLKNT